MKILKNVKKRNLFFLSSALTFVFLLFISLIYFRQATTFSFVDEYTNIVAGYFLNHGRNLYTDIFFHHQILMPYISAFFQQITHPDSLYKVILYHRLLVILFALVMDLLLIYRFRYAGIGFVLFFEPLKYYLFGNLFLAESFIVYPLVYLVGLVWENVKNKTINSTELVISTLFTWFIIFMREPFIPLALIMYLFLLWKAPSLKAKTISFVLLTFLSLSILFTVNLKDYFFQVITLNTTIVIASEANSPNLFISFFYPIVILFDNTWTFYRTILLGIDILFLCAIGYFLYKKYSITRLVILFILLGLANIRWISPGTNFYLAYHAIVWFGMFTFVTFLLIRESYKINPKFTFISILGATTVFLGMLIYPSSYLWEQTNREQNFTLNYEKYSTNGKIINMLSDSTDTVFVDYWDTLLYWQADRDSSYKYAMYLPVTNSVPQFKHERENMFKNNPPTFYYTDCLGSETTELLSKEVKEIYEQFYFSDKATCLFINKKKLESLSEQQLLELKNFGYYLPNSL